MTTNPELHQNDVSIDQVAQNEDTPAPKENNSQKYLHSDTVAPFQGAAIPAVQPEDTKDDSKEKRDPEPKTEGDEVLIVPTEQSAKDRNRASADMPTTHDSGISAGQSEERGDTKEQTDPEPQKEAAMIPINQVAEDDKTNISKAIDSPQVTNENSLSTSIEESPSTVTRDTQSQPTTNRNELSNNVDNQMISHSDTIGVSENNSVILDTELNVTPDEANDNLAVVSDDIIPLKTNGASSSKRRNYCADNWLLVFAICLAILTIIATTVLAILIVPTIREKTVRPLRLPGDVLPEHYVLEIRPHLIPDNSRFDGSVVITILCVNVTNKLILHSKDLEIDENDIGVLNLEGGHSPFVLTTDYDEENEFVIFTLCENLEERTKYDVRVRFRGALKIGRRSGFSVIDYERNGETKYMALTKFESIFARTAFPCFDEPALKATFDVNVIRWKNMTSLSNMKLLASFERDEDWVIDMYQRSVPMSTYLVTIVVGELEKLQEGKVSMWACKDVDSYQFALNLTTTLLDFYESFLEVPYSLSKLDQLSAEDFETGAMENWGIVIYEKKTIKSGIAEDWSIARIISHELAHQWFGNLVTMKWWDDLWLNEGFASYFGYFGAHIINEEWKLDQKIVSSYIDEIMHFESRDTTGSTVPIVRPFENTNAIKDYRNHILYQKGAAIVRMMHMFLGNSVFRKGLKSYLEEYAFGNAVQDDLWRHLTMAQSKVDRIDIKKVMDPWMKQRYFPLVTVNRDYNNHSAIVEQTSCVNGLGVESKDLWPVPITWIDKTEATSRNKTVKLWLHSEIGILRNLPGKESWILVNVERLGYYRVNYDDNNWELLLWQLRHNSLVIPTLNRRQLILDSLYFARRRELSHIVALDILTFYPFEKEPEVLEALFIENNYMTYYRNMIRGTEAISYWKEFVHYLLKPIFIRYSRIWREENVGFGYGTETFLWESVGALCYEGFSPCLLAARKKFKGLFEGKGLPHYFDHKWKWATEDLICALARNASKVEWEIMLQTTHPQNLYLVSFLACTENKKLLQRWINEYFLPPTFSMTVPLPAESWSYIINYCKENWKNIETLGYPVIMRYMINQVHNKKTLEMVKELYELYKSDFDKEETQEIHKAFSIAAKQIATPDEVATVVAWLKSRGWQRVKIREF